MPSVFLLLSIDLKCYGVALDPSRIYFQSGAIKENWTYLCADRTRPRGNTGTLLIIGGTTLSEIGDSEYGVLLAVVSSTPDNVEECSLSSLP